MRQTTVPLVRENEGTFREPEREDGKSGLAFQHYQKRLRFRLGESRVIAQNLSDDLFRTIKYEKGRPDDYLPADKERPQYGLKGNLFIEDRRSLGFIGEGGVDSFVGPFYLDMHTRTQVNDRGQVWFFEKGEFNDREGIYISVYVSEERMLWLLSQIKAQPNASVFFDLEVMVWQHEVDASLAEWHNYQDFFIERAKPGEIVGCTFGILDPELPEWKEPDPYGDEEDGIAAEPVPTLEVSFPPKPSSSDLFLQRMVRGVGWVIALQVLLLLAVLTHHG